MAGGSSSAVHCAVPWLLLPNGLACGLCGSERCERMAVMWVTIKGAALRPDS